MYKNASACLDVTCELILEKYQSNTFYKIYVTLIQLHLKCAIKTNILAKDYL